jgi:hypothetical protein
MVDYSNEYYQYFIKSFMPVIKNHYGKVAVVKGEHNFDYFDDMETAKEAVKDYEGSCYIGECVGDQDTYYNLLYNLSQLDDVREDCTIDMKFE